MRAIKLCIVLGVCQALLLVSRPGVAEPRLPPLGQRTYLLDGATGPVVIRKGDAPVPGAYLRDPGRSGAVIIAKPAPVHRAVAKKPARGPGRASQLRFRKLTVGGQLLRPRVEFARELLPIERADEPVQGQFFDRVFAPAQDDAF